MDSVEFNYQLLSQVQLLDQVIIWWGLEAKESSFNYDVINIIFCTSWQYLCLHIYVQLLIFMSAYFVLNVLPEKALRKSLKHIHLELIVLVCFQEVRIPH